MCAGRPWSYVLQAPKRPIRLDGYAPEVVRESSRSSGPRTSHGLRVPRLRDPHPWPAGTASSGHAHSIWPDTRSGPQSDRSPARLACARETSSSPPHRDRRNRAHRSGSIRPRCRGARSWQPIQWFQSRVRRAGGCSRSLGCGRRRLGMALGPRRRTSCVNQMPPRRRPAGSAVGERDDGGLHHGTA
jgi:hypothetical protein